MSRDLQSTGTTIIGESVYAMAMAYPKRSAPAPRPVSERVGCMALPAAGLLLCAVYANLVLLRPTRTILAARHWSPLPCRVTSSAVVRRTDTGTRTVYRLDIRYQYQFAGRTFTSDRFDAVDDDGSGGFESKQRTAQRYPPGTITTCYVNPQSPGEALIDRTFPARMWWGIIPVLGILLCLPGLLFAAALEVFDRKT